MKNIKSITTKGLGAAMLLGAVFLTSCEKNDTPEVTAGDLDNSDQRRMELLATSSNSMLFQSTFETTTDFNQWYFESPLSNSITRVSTPVKNGSYSAKFTLNKTDPEIWGAKRAEVTYAAEKKGPVKSERWYGLSMFLPTSYIADPSEEVVFQWHGVNKVSLDGYSMDNPPLVMYTKNGRWVFAVKSAATRAYYDLGAYDTNNWTDWVLHIKFSYEDDGLLQIWKNGVLVLDKKGPNTYHDTVGNFFKMGIYKFGWTQGYTSNTTQRTLYFDEVKVGNENSSYNEVSPSKNSTSPEPSISTSLPAPTTTSTAPVFAVNAGGSSFTASNGITYLADTKYSGGSTKRYSSRIANTEDDVLYQSERIGNFRYNIPVANGTYEVTFKFCENAYTTPNRRIFDIEAEGQKVINNLDVYKLAGFRVKYDVVKTITVTDGVLNIKTISDASNATLSAFHVIKK